MSKSDNQLEKSEQKDRYSGINRTLFKDTLTRALLADDSKKLRKLCDQILDIALDGSLPLQDRLAFMKVIIERVDGRPHQAIEITDNNMGLPSASQFKIVKVEPAKDE